ncbi:MAG: hypothetical protein UHN02_02490 [Acutalibacteraceae bacterium]|nr:hypothetical protein [Acutalibacteraceae bacterium]
MTKTKEKIMFLMNDFDTLCKQSDISYAFYGKSAAQVYSGRKYTFNYVQVMMTCNDLLKFIKLTDLPANRKISGMFNDKNYAGLTVRFEDTTTSSIEIYSRKSRKIECGIYVEIIPIRNVADTSETLKTRFHEQGFEYSHCPIHLVNGIFSKFSSLCFKIAKLFSNNINSKNYFYKMMKKYGTDDKPYWATRECFKSTRFYEEFPLQELREVSFLECEQPFYIPEKATEFFRKAIGIKWRRKAFDSEKNGFSCFENMSIEQLYDTMQKYNISIEKYKTQRYIITDAISRAQDAKKNKAWDIAQMVGHRIKLQNYYSNKMDRIHNLIKSEDYNRLYRIMNKNRAAVRKYLKIGYGFAVNKELFDIQNQLYLNEGKIDLVKKLNKITPKSFLTD